jgi:hypothetical protein
MNQGRTFLAKKLYKNKKILIALSVIAIAVIGAAVYVKLSHKNPPSDQQKLQQEQKKAAPTNPKKDNEASRRQQQSEAQANQGSKVSIYISSLTQDDSMVYVGAIVEGQSSGTCTANFTSGSNSLTKQAPVGIVTSYYACQGFNVPKSEFPAKGNWSVKVDFSNGSAIGSTDTKNFTIN